MVAYRLDYRPGDFIDSKYRVIKKVGTGSYGDVFMVDDTRSNVFALKLLRLWEVSSELHDSLNEKFKQEYLTAQISSEYLVHSLDFGIIQGNPYFLMEFCPKGDLSKLIGKDLSKLPRYARDILEGLYALHSEGKIHRDLKLENVLIRENGKAALTDFGVVGEMNKANRLSEVGWWRKRPKQIQGTPLYMAPEMAERAGGGVTYLPTVDLWSFGVMMFEILTSGSFPFGNIESIDDLPKYRERAKKGDWDIDLLKKYPFWKDWTHIINKCLEPDYRKRYQSAFEILQDMKPMIGSISQRLTNERLSRSLAISRLVITQGDNLGAVYGLANYINNRIRMLRIGRENDNNIVLPESKNTYVSRHHFTLEMSKDGAFWTIRDGQWKKNVRQWVTSTNGTYLNATPVSVKGLKVFTGDIITVGEYKIKVI
ncbi:MAG: FHA domain-containing serine/threonine-protein kinase [Prevotellaceae bacterium]|nr:FHA domain-containing serine/threonine-protein kinase [Prevotellaceae bacterium]